MLETAIDEFGLGGRAYTGILKAARTIADLEGGIASNWKVEAVASGNLEKGSAKAGIWLNAQQAVDLWDAARTAGRKIERISPLRAA